MNDTGVMASGTERLTALAVDDEPLNLRLLQTLLSSLELDVVTVESGREAQELMTKQSFDLLLFDVMMPDLDGLQLTRWARENPNHKDVPILILTSLSSKSALIEAFDAGAVDFLSKPFHGPELVHRVKAQMRLRRLQRRMEAFANELNLQVLRGMQTEAELLRSREELAEANKTLADWAHRDTLTGLWNRRKAWDLMEYESHRSQRRECCIGVAMLDIDKFKSINDTLGHDTGDRILKATANILTGALRKGDILARWGGEEFLAVFPETDLDGARTAAEKLRASVQQAEWDLPDRHGITVSIGVTIKAPGQDWDPALKGADIALYQAKESGRNRVVTTS